MYVINLETNKVKRAGHWVKMKVKKGLNWMSNNKELVIVLGPLVIGGIVSISKLIGKNVNLHKETNNKDLYCYDRSLGHYWKLNRKLNNNEWIQVNDRRKNGEALGDILDSMKVLK